MKNLIYKIALTSISIGIFAGCAGRRAIPEVVAVPTVTPVEMKKDLSLLENSPELIARSILHDKIIGTLRGDCSGKGTAVLILDEQGPKGFAAKASACVHGKFQTRVEIPRARFATTRLHINYL